MEKQETENQDSKPKIQNKHHSISDADAEPPDDVVLAGAKEPQKPRAVITSDSQQATTKPVEVLFDDDGHFVWHNHKDLRNAAVLATTQHKGTIPQVFIDAGQEAVQAALIFLKQHHMPYSFLNKCAWFKGRLTVYSYGVNALAEKSHRWNGYKVFYLDAKQENICMANKNLHEPVWAVVVQIKPKGQEYWNEYFFTIEDAKRAGIYAGNWLKYPRDMLFHKANSRGLNTEFSAALQGVIYHEDMVEALEESSPRVVNSGAYSDMASAKDLNKEL